ncbi:hypothetical protein Clacol_004264 [Clathrus columnatus]|uniref:Major facilitator superfamily (MFS) profile domain-containing protein n=1 Tax=Clathrus columnatus TaxID=1419009 RepID=A0AAV5A9A1_9AGAM|nr:hypothetical protein Clacol_004264 [Clathrus columnatus]
MSLYSKLASYDEYSDFDSLFLDTKSPEWIEARDQFIRQHSPGDGRDGGGKAWCTLLGGWLTLFATFGHISSFGVYQDLYVRAGTASSSDISWIGSVQLFFFVVMGLPAGRLVDKGHFKKIVILGAIIYILRRSVYKLLTNSFYMLSLAHIDRYYQLFLAQGIGMGIGSGLLYIPSMTVQGQHWQKRRAMAMGIIITGSSVGGIAYPILLNNLFQQSGFGFAVRAAAILTTGLLVLAIVLMSDRIIPRSNAEETEPANVREILTDVPFILGMAFG